MTSAPQTLDAGCQAPDFTLPIQDGTTLTLSSLQGKPVIVYFYPKDNTPGCTTEALDFTALKPEFDQLGATVIGISPDSTKKHQNFIDKHQLAIPLVADIDKQAIEAFGVWVEKKNYGRTYMGVERSTFLIDGEGKLIKIWRKVRVKNHAQEVLEATKALLDQAT